VSEDAPSPTPRGSSRTTAYSLHDGPKPSRAPDELPPGTIVGSYRLLELLGEGGMGRVYVAEHVRLGRKVALKILRDELSCNPSAVSRFFAEARAVNRISHENIVEVTDFVESPGRSCFVMELLNGEDLGLRLMRQRLPLPVIVDIGRQIASALAAVHAAGIIHRDLKPDNIYLVDRSPARSPNFVKLLDFGVAKLIDTIDNGVALHSTAAGQIIGTPAYMSPEQACGLRVDHRTDIYALGVILYEMLVGAVPFEAAHFGELIVQQMTIKPLRPSIHDGRLADIPPELDDLVIALLSKNLDTRPRSMSEVEAHLRDLQERLGPMPAWHTGRFHVSDSGPVRRITPPVEELATAQTVDVGPDESGRFRTLTPPSAIPIIRRATPASGIPVARPPTPSPDAITAAGTSPMAAVEERPAPAPIVAPTPPMRAHLRLILLLAALVASGVFGAWVETRRADDPPAPPAAAPVITHVRVKFTSRPAGATVKLDGQELGVTPFATTLPRDRGTITVELAKLGYVPTTEELELSGDGTLSVVLAPLPKIK